MVLIRELGHCERAGRRGLDCENYKAGWYCRQQQSTAVCVEFQLFFQHVSNALRDSTPSWHLTGFGQVQASGWPQPPNLSPYPALARWILRLSNSRNKCRKIVKFYY